MQYIHIINLEKFHPGYKDRTLQWAKIYINMASGDPDTELLDETDWSRLVKLILLELRAKKPLPLNDEYLNSKGFNLKKRSIDLTLNMLHNFIEVVTIENNDRHVDKIREDKEKKRKYIVSSSLSEVIVYLNEKAGTSFSTETKSNIAYIKARFNEGRTLEQFKTVIDRKCAEWLSDPKMMQYLRPSTLFNATNFENYLNQKDGMAKQKEIDNIKRLNLED